MGLLRISLPLLTFGFFSEVFSLSVLLHTHLTQLDYIGATVEEVSLQLSKNTDEI